MPTALSPGATGRRRRSWPLIGLPYRAGAGRTLRRRRSRGPAEIPPGAVRAGSAFDPEQDAALPHDLFGFLQVVFGPRLPANPVDVLGDVFLDRYGLLRWFRPVIGDWELAL